jgi:hypothetical protein
MTMGKGLDAILKAPNKLRSVDRESEDLHTASVVTTEVPTEEVTSEELNSEEVATAQVTTEGVTISHSIIAKAVSDAKRSPRISTWSPVAVGTLKSLWMTQPQFSMSDEIRTLLEDALAKKYPELYKLVTEEMEKSN